MAYQRSASGPAAAIGAVVSVEGESGTVALSSALSIDLSIDLSVALSSPLSSAGSAALFALFSSAFA